MTISFIRCLFLVISGVVGYYIGIILGHPILGAQYGCVCSLILILIEKLMSKVSVRGLSSVVFGLLLGVFMAKLISNILRLLPLGDFLQSVSEIILTLIFSYFGAVMALRGRDEFSIIIPYLRFKRQNTYEGMTLLDTSAIIDSRIYDVYKVKFLSGRLVVPSFVLKELQAIADSADETKRQAGRRGLESIKKMQSDNDIDISIQDEDNHAREGVDMKLINLAKMMSARICTTDFNLGRVAALQDVEVLNINELAAAVKSVVFVGEVIYVKLIKRGKEATQAVAYLDDGTMVIVADAKDFIGKEVNVIVTSLLQTPSGKMIFAKLKKQ